MAQKSHPHKETFNNKAQTYRLNIINKFKPTINSGSPVRKHLITKFKFIDSLLLTNSNPQSIVVLLCLYKQWHHFPGYKLFVSLPLGIHHICIPTFPFDLPTQSGTYTPKPGMHWPNHMHWPNWFLIIALSGKSAFVCVCVCVRVCACVCVRACACMHACAHAHAHAPPPHMHACPSPRSLITSGMIISHTIS